MPAETKAAVRLEIGHVLFIDIVGYSRLLISEQSELLGALNNAVRETGQFRSAEADGQLVRLPTGDGMALVFRQNPEQPVRCALEISQALKNYPKLQLRMGIHSGPVNEVADVNERANIAGAGINIAQRVMDCGDAGHILLSKHVAEDLVEYGHWRSFLHDLGQCEVKHGLRLHVFNLYRDGVGNLQVPDNLKRRKRWRQKAVPIRPIRKPGWPKVALTSALIISAIALVISPWIFRHRESTRKIGSATPELTTSNVAVPVSEKSIAV